jgi:transcriptional regulator with XRE-family HTH domain
MGLQNYISYKNLLKEQLQLRKSRNPSYSIRALARDIGLPYSAIARLLGEGKKLNPTHLYKVALYLKVPEEKLISFIFHQNN